MPGLGDGPAKKRLSAVYIRAKAPDSYRQLPHLTVLATESGRARN